MAEDPEELIPIGPAARLAGVTVDTVRRWEQIGKVSSIRTAGNQRRFRRGDILALLKRPAASPDSETAA